MVVIVIESLNGGQIEILSATVRSESFKGENTLDLAVFQKPAPTGADKIGEAIYKRLPSSAVDV